MVRNPIADLGRFVQAWLRSPRRIGAVVPPGQALAQVITGEIEPECAPVIELGAGTGAFTRVLIERGIPENRLVLVEEGSELARLLQLRFPSARTLWMDASRGIST